MHLPATHLMIHSGSLLSHLRLCSCLKMVGESLHGWVIRCGLWPLRFPDLTSVTFIYGEV